MCFLRSLAAVVYSSVIYCGHIFGEHFPDSLAVKTTQQVTTLSQFSQDTQTIWEQKKDCVVKVFGTKHDHAITHGTGFFIDQEGRILTTATVTSEAESLWVEYGNLSYAAQLLGKDDLTNLAVLELLKVPEHFSPIEIPQCTQRTPCTPGTIILAFGSVFEMAPAPMLGMVTGEHLFYGNHVFVTSYIRSTIEILGGESGAPVFDATGNFYGILIASLPEIRSSFLIPAEALHRVIEPLKKGYPVPYSAAGFVVHGELSGEGEKILVISALQTNSSIEHCMQEPTAKLTQSELSAVPNEKNVTHKDEAIPSVDFTTSKKTAVNEKTAVASENLSRTDDRMKGENISEEKEALQATNGTDDLAVGDILLAIDGIKVQEEKDIANCLFFKAPGTRVELTILRKNTAGLNEQRRVERKLYSRAAK